MHLHLHLKKCILDHGPAHSFWCFSFERYNGLLGSFHTNQKNIEIQLMRKFISSQMLLNAKASVHQEFLTALKPSDHQKISTMPSLNYADTDCVKLLNISTAHLPSTSFTVDHTVSILSPSRHRVFDADYVSKLELLYQQLYPDLNIISISPFYQHAGRATLCGDILGSVMNATSCQ
jgi:hypothetical protein